MKRLCVCNVVMAAGLLVAGAAEAQSLADVAKQERERRQAVKEPARVYTEADVEKAAPLTTAAARPQPEAPATAAGADGAAAGSTTPAAGTAAAAGATDAKADKAAEAPKDEAGWQARVQQAREDVARSRRLLAAMEAQLLNVGVRNANARVNGQSALNVEAEQEAAKEVARLRADVEKHAAALAEIEAEARTAGIPPGWVR